MSGDGQSAAPGNSLDRPLVARLHDRLGHPVRDAAVRWTADNGEITPVSAKTDSSGTAMALWRLGDVATVQRAWVYARGADSIQFRAYVDSNAVPDRLPPRLLELQTYEGSGQVVHPDVAVGPFEGLDDAPRLVITPYPGGNQNFENPSLFVRTGRLSWTVPSGVTNPLVSPVNGYLSDPDIVWLGDRRELWVFYRHVVTSNDIELTTSADGVHWSAPGVVVHAPNHEAISPSVVRRAPDDWLMWTVNAGTYGCSSASTAVELRRSSDGQSWSPPVTVSLTQPGVYPWHVDVQWIPALGEYWALFNAKVAGSCTTDALYMATSADGMTWRTYPSPVLRRGAIPEFADIVYRATLAYDTSRDVISIWHSGARYASGSYQWRAAFERIRRADLLDKVNRADVAARIPSTAPPLTNATAP